MLSWIRETIKIAPVPGAGRWSQIRPRPAFSHLCSQAFNHPISASNAVRPAAAAALCMIDAEKVTHSAALCTTTGLDMHLPALTGRRLHFLDVEPRRQCHRHLGLSYTSATSRPRLPDPSQTLPSSLPLRMHANVGHTMVHPQKPHTACLDSTMPSNLHVYRCRHYMLCYCYLCLFFAHQLDLNCATSSCGHGPLNLANCPPGPSHSPGPVCPYDAVGKWGHRGDIVPRLRQPSPTPSCRVPP